MTNKQILKKAIEKAVKNGWDKPDYHFDYAKMPPSEVIFTIFSHDFAKAFWGEEAYEQDGLIHQSWTQHLQIMVLEKDPIKYLKKFIV